MRLFLTGMFLVLSCSATVLVAEEPVHVHGTPDAERIAKLVRDLGSENYVTREQATKQLMTVGPAAKAHLEIACESPDPEVRQRATRILLGLGLDSLGAQETFLAAMKGPWQEALKEGRLVGPLLGAMGTIAQPRTASSTGGSEEAARTGEFVDRGLAMLARTQSPEGRWRAKALGARAHAEVEQTALALLAFLGAGHTEKVGMYKDTVRRAVGWLKSRQRQDGAILNENWTEVDHVAHALAVMSLSEAAGMANISDTKDAAQRAVEFTVRQQDAHTGGFSRGPGVAPDLFTTAIHVLALKSAKVAGLKIPPSAFEGVIRFLDSVEDKESKTYRYVSDGKPSARAGIMGVVCRQFLGWKKEDLREPVAALVKELGDPTVTPNDSDVVTNWFGTLAAFQQGGEIWKNWNDALRNNLAKGQARDGQHEGGWAPRGVWGRGGHILSTALSALALEVYYRYLPMYK